MKVLHIFFTSHIRHGLSPLVINWNHWQALWELTAVGICEWSSRCAFCKCSVL